MLRLIFTTIAIILIWSITAGFIYMVIKALKTGEIDAPRALSFNPLWISGTWKANRKKDKGEYWVWLFIMIIVTAFFILMSIAWLFPLE